jgi:hypothetical protein
MKHWLGSARKPVSIYTEFLFQLANWGGLVFTFAFLRTVKVNPLLFNPSQ